VELPEIEYIQTGLFLGFADHRVLQAFAVIDEPARQRPSERRIAAFDQHNAFRQFDKRVNSQERTLQLVRDIIYVADRITLKDIGLLAAVNNDPHGPERVVGFDFAAEYLLSEYLGYAFDRVPRAGKRG